MNKHDWKVLIDILMFVDMCSIAVIGLLLGYVIPTGSGPGVNKYFLGLHRHDWGDLHLNLSLFLLFLLIFHLVFNWTWIAATARRYFGERHQQVLTGLCFAWIAVLFIGWMLTSPAPHGH